MVLTTILIVTKHVKVVTYCERLQSKKSQDPLIMWSCIFFLYDLFRKKTLKLSPTSCFFSNYDSSSRLYSNFFRVGIFLEKVLLLGECFFKAVTSSELLVQYNSYFSDAVISFRVFTFLEQLLFQNSHFF